MYQAFPKRRELQSTLIVPSQEETGDSTIWLVRSPIPEYSRKRIQKFNPSKADYVVTRNGMYRGADGEKLQPRHLADAKVKLYQKIAARRGKKISVEYRE